jgi:hypothetical protein
VAGWRVGHLSPITGKVHPIYAARIWRMGKSVVFPLFAAVADALRIRPDDLMLMWVHPPFITIRLADLGNVRPIDHFTQDGLVESWRQAVGDE